jgi:hypothetical protein
MILSELNFKLQIDFRFIYIQFFNHLKKFFNNLIWHKNFELRSMVSLRNHNPMNFYLLNFKVVYRPKIYSIILVKSGHKRGKAMNEMKKLKIYTPTKKDQTKESIEINFRNKYLYYKYRLKCSYLFFSLLLKFLEKSSNWTEHEQRFLLNPRLAIKKWNWDYLRKRNYFHRILKVLT